MGRSKVLRRAIAIAQKQHGAKASGARTQEPLSFSQQQQAVKTTRRKAFLDQYPSLGVREVGAAVQLLNLFPEDSQPACRAANSLCSLLGSSSHITPGPTLSKILKQSYLSSSFEKSTPGDWTTASFQGAWQAVREGTREKVREWQEVGVSVDSILGVVRRARSGGRMLARHEYVELLKVCLCMQKGWGGGGPAPRPLASLEVLMDAMVQDCGTDEMWDIMIASSFQLSTSEVDISAVCEALGRAAKVRPKMFHTEQLAAALTADNTPKRVMDLFTQQILSTQTPPTMSVYESLLATFARHYQLVWALQVFNTVTGRFGIAPSRTVYNTLTILMTKRALKGDKMVTKTLCHHILAATEAAYDGRPPLWVYGEMCKPLALLMGLKAYHIMYKNCEAKLDEMGVTKEEDRNDRLRSVWRQSLYVSLIRGSLVRGDEELALHMLSELRRWGYVVSTMAYEYLLQSVNHPRHLQQYLPVLLGAMTDDLSWTTGAALQTPLITAVGNIYKNSPNAIAPRSAEVPGFVLAAGRGLLQASLSDSTHENCLRDLETLATTTAQSHTTYEGVHYLEQSATDSLTYTVAQ